MQYLSSAFFEVNKPEYLSKFLAYNVYVNVVKCGKVNQTDDENEAKQSREKRLG